MTYVIKGIEVVAIFFSTSVDLKLFIALEFDALATFQRILI